MRIAILTQYFPPEMGAPQARLYELAIRLQARGHKLTILTAMPNYPTGRIFDSYRGKWFCEEQMDGLRVIRTALYPSKSTRFLPRLLSYMSFVFTALVRGSWAVGKQDVLIVESPPLFLGFAGVPISWITRSRMIFNCSDIWPDVLVRIGSITSRKVIWALEALEGFMYRRSALVAVTNPGAVSQVTSRFPRVPCSVISNGVDTRFFSPEHRSEEIRREFGIQEGQFAVGYCGLHGIAQGLEVVVKAAEKLRERRDIRFVMIGDGPTKETLKRMAAERGLDNIAFFDRQPKSRMASILASMDVSLIPLAASLPGTMPSKTYEALAAGIPFIVTAGCEAEPLVRKYDVGRLFEAGNSEQLADAIVELASSAEKWAMIRQNAIQLSKRFDRDSIAARTEKLLEAVVQGKPLPAVEW